MTAMSRALLVGAALAVAAPVHAQEALSLGDAIARALASHPSIAAVEAARQEAAARVEQARAGWLPRVDVAEAWQRGNQPVYVFGSLLTQGNFTAANFAIDALNRPDPLTNHRFSVVLQQPIFDGFATAAAMRGARTGVEAAAEQRALASQELALGVTAAFGSAIRAQAETAAAAAAVVAAEEDLKRVQARRDAGLATEADVLAVQVHLAEARARETYAAGTERTARAQLNELIGAPLDAVHALAIAPPVEIATEDAQRLEQEALASRPEARLASLQVKGAEAGYTMARATWLPQAGFQSAWEFNGGSFGDRASSWVVGAELRFNLFRGGADKARVAEARAAITRHQRERERAEQRVRLDVVTARAQLDTARARAAVGREAKAQAAESQRIVRDRYEAGLEDVTSLLRAAQAAQQADALDIAARVDVVIATAGLERALGRLPQPAGGQ
jgi:outer membrane protein TolC